MNTHWKSKKKFDRRVAEIKIHLRPRRNNSENYLRFLLLIIYFNAADFKIGTINLKNKQIETQVLHLYFFCSELFVDFLLIFMMKLLIFFGG